MVRDAWGCERLTSGFLLTNTDAVVLLRCMCRAHVHQQARISDNLCCILITERQ